MKNKLMIGFKVFFHKFNIFSQYVYFYIINIKF